MQIQQKKEGAIEFSILSFHPVKDKVVIEKNEDHSLRIGDIVIKGEFKTDYLDPEDTVFGLKKDGSPLMETVHALDKSDDFSILMKATPEIVRDGEIHILYNQVPEELIFGPLPRMAIGYDQAGEIKVIHVKESITIKQLAQIMKILGCHRAMAIYGEGIEEKKLVKSEKKNKEKGQGKNERVSRN